MTDPLTPSRKFKNLTADKLQQQIEHAQENAALPHEEAADPYYDPYLCEQIKMLADDMKFPEQWAAEIGVTEARMFGWIERYPDFAEAYAIAITKLRAAFTQEMVHVAKGNRPKAIAPLYTLLAKKRFIDLYGDAPPPAIGLPGPAAPRDITPGQGQVIEGTAVEDLNSEQLRSELEALRKRHNVG